MGIELERSSALRGILARLGLTAAFTNGRRPFAEATKLVEVGPDAFGRDAQLAPEAADPWQDMVTAAAADGAQLLLVSAFRSYEYQASLWERKLGAGQTVDEICRVLGVPGFSQHHTGCAIDVGSPECTELTEAFEHSREFGWLTRRAGHFGFTMSYPRGNPSGVAYEPWHWFYNRGFVLD